MMCFLSIAGKNWESVSLAAFAFLLLAFCAFGLSFGSLVWKIVERTRRSRLTESQSTGLGMSPSVPTERHGSTKAPLFLVLGLAIGGTAGSFAGYMLGHDARGRRSYTDVLVVARHDSTHYTLQPEWMKPWEMVTCSPMNWEQGQKMQFLNFKYSAACDDVADGAFVFYSEADGRRTIFSREVLNAGN